MRKFTICYQIRKVTKPSSEKKKIYIYFNTLKKYRGPYIQCLSVHTGKLEIPEYLMGGTPT